MAFLHGKECDVYVNGYDLTAFLQKFALSGNVDSVETSTFATNAKTYIPGMGDATLDLEGLYEADHDSVVAANQDVFHTAMGLAASGSVVTAFPQGESAALVYGLGLKGDQNGYEVNAAFDDVEKCTASFQSSVAFDNVASIHPKAQESATTQTAARDGGAATTLGGAGYLHVFAVTGTTPTLDVVIEDSADGASGWAVIATFTQVAGLNARSGQRVAIAGTIRRYTRARWTIGGTGGPTMTFSVSVSRK